MPVKGFLRRKSTGNELEADLDATTSQGTFRTLDRAEVEAQAALRAAEKEKEKQHKGIFSRFSGGGTKPLTPASGKVRQHSFDEDSPGGQRGSNSSSAANSALSRVYDTSSQSARFSSSSTLPSTGDDGSDNMFAHTHTASTPNLYTSSPHHTPLRGAQTWAQTPPKVLAKGGAADQHGDSYLPQRPNGHFRERSQTQSSYASTAIAPRVDANLPASTTSFSSEFGNMFESLDSQAGTNNDASTSRANEIPTPTPGRSLLAGKQKFQHDPVETDRSLAVEAPLKSWDSRDSGERLIASPTDSEMSPPPVPAHAYLRTPSPAEHSFGPNQTGSQYGMSERGMYNSMASSDTYSRGNGKAPVPAVSAPAREPLSMSAGIRQPLSTTAGARQPFSASATPRKPVSTSASSTNTLQTPSSSRSTSNNATPRAPAHSAVDGAKLESVALNSSPATGTDDEDTPLFDAATISSVNAARKFVDSEPPRRVMGADEFRRATMLANSRPPPQDDSSSEDDEYEDEDEEERHQAQRELRRKQEAQLAASREVMRRTVGNDGARPGSQTGVIPSNGFPIGMSLRDDDWENEEIPLGILKAHGFPSSSRQPTRPANATPSFTGIAERPASAGALGGGTTRSSVPVFARNLPMDPFRVEMPTDREAFHLGGGIPQPGPRSSTGPPSAYGGSTNRSYMDVIQAEERAKAIRRGSPANRHYGYGDTMPRTQTMSSMQQPQWGSQPQFQPQLQYQPQQPFPMMPQMPMGGQSGQVDHMQMAFMMAQQMLAAQQQQAAMNAQMSQMNLAAAPQPSNQYGYQQNGFLAPNRPQTTAGLRPQSIASNSSNVRPQGPNRFSSAPNTRVPQSGNVSYDASSGFLPAPSVIGFSSQQGGGYAPSIAPSERSNIGLASRYRPVVALPPDAGSSVSSATAQAAPGAPAVGGKTTGGVGAAGGVEEEAAWKGLGERRKKWGRKGAKKEGEVGGLGELWHGEGA